MSTFGGIYFTNKGRMLQSKVQTGNNLLKFTRIVLGDGTLGSQSISDLNTVIHEIKSLQINKLKILTEGKVVVGGVFTNQDLASGFFWRELGLYANDPDIGEILYCYGNAGNLAEYIPGVNGSDIFEKNIQVVASIGNASNVSAVIDESLVYATLEMLSEHKESGDHDGRYYTEDELGSTTIGASGAKKIGIPSIAGVAGNDVETVLANFKLYVDAAIQGLAIKAPVKVATTVNITLSGTQTIDGVAVVAGDRVLVKNQTTASLNGIYVVSATSWSRASDANTSAKLASAFVLVQQGTSNLDCSFLMTTDGAITIGTTAINWVQFSGAGQIVAGGGLVKSGNTLAIGGGAVSDGMIGVRTINDATPQTSGAADSLTSLLGQLANMLKRVTGGASWYTTPSVTLVDAKNHIFADAPHTGHAPSGYGLGGVAKRLATGYDLNTLTNNGWYDVNNATNGVPEIGTGWTSVIVVCSGDPKYVTQLAFDMTNTSGNMMWIRKSHSSGLVWTPWERILNKNYADTLYAPSGFGLGTIAQIVTGDWNSYTITGFYRGSNLTNSPPYKSGLHSSSKWWYVMVAKHDNNYVSQLAVEYMSGDIYNRVNYAGTWTAWRKSITQSDLGDMGASSTLNSVDLNNIISTGFYQVTPGCVNVPDEGFSNAFLTVVGSNVTATTQTIVSFDDVNGTARLATRSRGLTGAWTDWKVAGADNYKLVNADGSGLVSSEKDLNNYTSTGFYALSIASPLNWGGGGAYGILQVTTESNGAVNQVLWQRNNYPVWRKKASSVGSWSSWDYIMTQAYSDALYLPKNTPMPLVAGGNSAGVHYRDVATYNNNNTSVTGILKIKLPKSWSNTMLDLVIKGHTHGGIGSGAWELRLGGYNYASGPIWQQLSAVLNREAPFTQVRFAHDGTNCCILLGTLTTTWNYPKLIISEVLAAFSNQTGWDTGWDISVIASETGLTNIQSLDASLSNQSYALTQPSGAAKDPGTTDLNAMTSTGFYRLQGSNYTNGPTSAIYGTLEVVYGTSTGLAQTIYFDSGDILNRAKSGSTWSSWGNLQRYQLTSADGTGKSYMGTSNFNTMLAPGQYTIDGTCDNNPRQGTSARGILEVKKLNTGRIIQEFTYDQDYIGSYGGCRYTRSYNPSTVTWSNWVESIDGNSNIQQLQLTTYDGFPTASGVTDFNNVTQTGIYAISSTTAITNAPFSGGIYGVLFVQKRLLASGLLSLVQTYVDTNSGQTYTRTLHSNVWKTWRRSITDDDFVNSLGASGYQKYPGGKIEQWGSLSITPTTVGATVSQTVNFPIVFPNACRSIVIVPHGAIPLMMDATPSSMQAANFIANVRRTDNNNPISVTWFAVGH
ncbi:gp53-like domain-containing protein [Clostridium intestinale]|uniref:gp53-like domain-containing protein n=1 Tax=Clostridium intestinale TaxID=36845 RepID=UPI002DD659BB|nr:hypothetical protein [Clostridium intestinale]WRY53918.1 hypothetical protein P8F83_12060 [Clostridium intestinale]